ncbi:MAG TPA: hypothetical protein VFI79_00580 [Gemmatimonadales bacterium]|nr:hypothetical protein [Gemmatimonadales bacterium]
MLERLSRFVGPELVTSLREERFREARFRRPRVVEKFVDLYDELGNRTQPGEPGIVNHELQQRSAPFDAGVLPLVSDPLLVQQGCMYAQQTSAGILESFALAPGDHSDADASLSYRARARATLVTFRWAHDARPSTT